MATVLAGGYQLDTPVAVGGSGIATPRESVAFTAGAGARFEAHGDAALELPGDAQHSFTGPGLVHLEGRLEVTTENREQDATTLDLANGPYELTLSPTEGGGWTHTVYTATPGIPGDSGSGFLDKDGKALGTLSTVAIAPLAGSNGVGDLAKELAYAQQNSGISGLTMANGTEPFSPLL